VIVWLWDADGPDRAVRGVTDDEERARQAAESWIVSGQAGAAQVERAQFVTGFAALTAHYKRTGHGWTARRARDDGIVTWVPLGRLSA
jgi:hypothetical protein